MWIYNHLLILDIILAYHFYLWQYYLIIFILFTHIRKVKGFIIPKIHRTNFLIMYCEFSLEIFKLHKVREIDLCTFFGWVFLVVVQSVMHPGGCNLELKAFVDNGRLQLHPCNLHAYSINII